MRLGATRTRISGASDHRTHEAIYLSDADLTSNERMVVRRWADDGSGLDDDAAKFRPR